MIRRLAATAIFAGITFLGQATTYYITPNGNDTHSGTSPSTAWRTIGRYQQIMYSLTPGDHVLFERGGIYPGIVGIGASGTSSQPIVIGAYGAGDRPIISGGVPIINWVQHNGNTWVASMATAPKYVIVNNSPITHARFPNTGFIRNQQGSTTQINCSQLTQPSGAWIGAKVHIRCTNWSYETATVTSSSSGTINFSAITTNLSNKNWGFFLSGKLSQLDTPGEWAWENGQLYLWAPGNADPNTLIVLASIHNKGVMPHWQRQHIRVENLTIQGQTSSALSNEGASNVIVTGCEMRYCFLGLQSSGNNNQYTNNEFHHTFASGMDVYDSGVLIENNTFNDIALIAGMGEDQWGSWGLRTTGYNAVVRSNRFSNIGYMAIDVKNNALVEKNVVVNATATLNDGAGIS
ncbi:MAG: right-handed parallel beta-helix repeat-containing protein, partial [Bacteroidota bacterium]|nr:right-handed parallel beta-helix repeat-containing protein [Bacteroidota bacterium]